MHAGMLRGSLLHTVPPAPSLPRSAKLALAISTAYASQCLASAARLAMPRLPHPPPLPPHQQPGGRLRICYVSSDFGNHPLSHLMCNGMPATCVACVPTRVPCQSNGAAAAMAHAQCGRLHHTAHKLLLMPHPRGLGP